MFRFLLFASITIWISSCKSPVHSFHSVQDSLRLSPEVVTQKVKGDPDDPAIWLNPGNPDSSLILGTDKHTSDGGIYVFNLRGQIDLTRTRTGMKRVNNVDVAYGFRLGERNTDIAVATERDKNVIRVFLLPSMQEADNGGIPVFTDDSLRLPMGIALYTRPSDHAIYAIVGRKHGPEEGYLEQYLLKTGPDNKIRGELVRRFGKYSGKKEIESIAVDNELGYVYYSDEQAGIRKYYADPDKGNEELSFFGETDFGDDSEGISFYKFEDGTGYILISDQARNTFNVYKREGEPGSPHSHTRVAVIPLSASQSDGSDMLSVSLPGFPGGLFVTMSDDLTFQYYSWEAMAQKAGLRIKK